MQFTDSFCSLPSLEVCVFLLFTVGESIRHLLVCYNKMVRPQLFIVCEMCCHCPNTYFDGRTTLIRNKLAFIISAAIISELDCSSHWRWCPSVAGALPYLLA